MNTLLQKKKLFNFKRNCSVSTKIEIPKVESAKAGWFDYYLVGIVCCSITGSFLFSYEEVSNQKKSKCCDPYELVLVSGYGFIIGMGAGIISPVLVPLTIPPLLCYGVSTFKVSRE